MKRNAFLEHVGWTGAGIVFALGSDGVFAPLAAQADAPAFSFVQISDSHIGFAQPANTDVAATLEAAVSRINALAVAPAFVIHTGDITHLATREQFDRAKSILGELRVPSFALPGEHDVIGSGAHAYAATFGRADAPDGWYAWDDRGVHFVALVNVFDFEIRGRLGRRQLDWLAADLAARTAGTPIVVFGHVPLYALYPAWGWTTEDGAEALSLLARFDSVTVLNGHIHQIITHREGNIRFFSAASTAYPQPAPGTAAHPGPLTIPPDRLLHVLGYRTVDLARGSAAPVDHDLG